jgi:hypothetical protein
MTDLEELKRLLSEATEGQMHSYSDGDVYQDSWDGDIPESERVASFYEPDEGHLYAAMRNALPGLIARVEELEGALRGLEPVLLSSASERFDACAELFYQETGIMAPGKSVPMEMYASQPPDDVRAAQYRKWHKGWMGGVTEKARAALTGDSEK